MTRFIFITIILLRVFAAKSCECNWPLTEFTAQDFNDYAVIFEGRLDTIYERGNYKILPFRVMKNYKGAKNTIIDIILYGSTCDPIFEIGKIYRVFGEKTSSPFYYVNKCSPTRELNIEVEKYVNYTDMSDTVNMRYNGKKTSMTKQAFLNIFKQLLNQQDSILNHLSRIDSGAVSTHFFNGQLSSQGFFYNHKATGKWTYFYPDGSIFKIVNYQYGLKNGYSEEYVKNERTNKFSKGNYLGNERCGKWILIENNKKRKKIIYDKKCL